MDWMEKTALYQGGPNGPAALILDTDRDSVGHDKLACMGLLPEVQSFIDTLVPEEGSRYVLINAMGASEYYGKNSNHDAFPEASLVHFPSNWKGKAEHDKPLGMRWTYGAPTFYQAGAYCFPAGTLVVAADRSRTPIEEFQVGDEVATPVGPRKVTHVFRRQYKGDGVRLRLRGEFEALTATSEHPFRVYQRAQIHCPHGYNRLNPGPGCKCCHDRGPQGPAQWLPAQEVLPGDYLLIPVPPHGDETPDPQFAELVGWVASEGYLGKKGDIQFTFSENNQDDIDSVLRCLRAQGVTPAAQRIPQYNTVHITVGSKDLSDRLRVYVEGVLAEKHLTGEVLRWDRDSLLRLLGAYIDGDGHVCGKGKNHGQLRIRSSSVQMLRSLADVIRALGVAATVQWDTPPGVMESPTNHRLYNHNGSGVVTVSAAWASDLLAYSRKRTNALPPKKSHGIPPLDGFFLAQVTEREDVELDEDVFNLEVEEEHTYVAGEVWVHNCHHQNKDFNKRIGDVAFVAWNDFMKRVELVGRLEEGRSHEHGGAGFWRSLDNGGFPSVSMGARVKFDRCSTCSDLDAFYKALATFDPSRHAHPGMAVLEVHNKIRESKGLQKGEVGGIRGIGRTRAEYCPCMKERAGQIDPKTGLQVFVYNDFPLFFDISLVFVGADRTAKVMKHLGAGTMTKKGSLYVPSNYNSPVQVGGTEKTASDEHREQVLKDVEERVRKLREPHRPKGNGAAVPETGIGGKTVEEALRNFDNYPTTVEIKTAMEKQADIEFGRKGDKHVQALGFFVGGAEGDDHHQMAGDVVSMLATHGSMDKTKAAFQEKHPNAYITVAYRMGPTPAKVPPKVLVYSGEAGGPIQYDFYENISGIKDLKKHASSSPEDLAKKAAVEKKARLAKKAEMDKKVDTQFSPESVPTLARGESDLPKGLLKEMSNHPLPDALATAGSLGIILRPREYQRVVLLQMEMPVLADQLDGEGRCFGYRPPSSSSSLGGMIPGLAQLLSSILPQRSGHAPFLRSRMDMAIHSDRKDPSPSPPSKLMDKLASDYQSYRQSIMQQILPSAQQSMASTGDPVLTKVAALRPEEIYNHLSYAYFRLAFQDEVAPSTSR